MAFAPTFGPALNMSLRPIKTTMEIKDITDDLLFLTDGRICLLLETSSINLDLKSDAEADVIMSRYQQLLQSLHLPLQILIKTRKVELTDHYSSIEAQLSQRTFDKQQVLLQDYRAFIEHLVVGKNMLTRHFYVVLSLRVSKQLTCEQVIDQLRLHKELLIKHFHQCELKAVQLDSLAIAQLFYAAFQPEKSRLQPLTKESLVLYD